MSALIIAALFGLDRLLDATLISFAYTTLIRVGIYAIMAASLNLVNGVTGQFSLGHAAFMAIGGYTGGYLSIVASPWVNHYAGWQSTAARSIVLLIGIALGALVAALAGLVVGLPSVRLRGDYLAIATLAFGEITRVVFQGWDALGGDRGLYGVPQVTNLFWTLLVAVPTVVLLRNLQWSGPGRDFMAVREDEIAAAAVGVNVVRAKIAAFMVAAAFAGAAGVLLVHLSQGVDPQQAGFMNSIEVVVMVVLGGMGSLTGSILGAALIVSLRAVIEGWSPLQPVARYENDLYPILLLAMMLLRREGLLGYREWSWQSVTPLFTRWRRMGRL
ncbi:MAG: branched-chain amino acid ABC transporter permease [Chloroflexi bacterium]|nr:branched-chain amino acid ABC transporter permease [Chloroflexota bacterium]